MSSALVRSWCPPHQCCIGRALPGAGAHEQLGQHLHLIHHGASGSAGTCSSFPFSCLIVHGLLLLHLRCRSLPIGLALRMCLSPILDLTEQRPHSMLTFEGSQIQGAQGIVEKLVVCFVHSQCRVCLSRRSSTRLTRAMLSRRVMVRAWLCL